MDLNEGHTPNFPADDFSVRRRKREIARQSRAVGEILGLALKESPAPQEFAGRKLISAAGSTALASVIDLKPRS